MVSQPFSEDNSNPFNLQDLEGTQEGLRTIFEQARPEFLQTGSQRDLFSGLFNRVVNDFLGELGNSFEAGLTPEESFTDFVNNLDFGRQFRRERPNRQSGLTSAARFLFDS